jgi:hypothetical protein
LSRGGFSLTLESAAGCGAGVVVGGTVGGAALGDTGAGAAGAGAAGAADIVAGLAAGAAESTVAVEARRFECARTRSGVAAVRVGRLASGAAGVALASGIETVEGPSGGGGSDFLGAGRSSKRVAAAWVRAKPAAYTVMIAAELSATRLDLGFTMRSTVPNEWHKYYVECHVYVRCHGERQRPSDRPAHGVAQPGPPAQLSDPALRAYLRHVMAHLIDQPSTPSA